MKIHVCDALRKIANAREHAYKAAGRLSLVHMNSCARIRNVAGYFSNYSAEKQFRAVLSVEHDLRKIMPSAQSRYSNMRNQINQLIQDAYERESHGNGKAL